MKHKTAVCTSHPNIALVKYWGKDDEKLITPIHGSFSVTLDFGSTITEVQQSSNQQNEFYLNGNQAGITPRLQTAIDFFQKYDGNNFNFSIKSTNSFPTAAGFASSAAGAAAFVGALAGYVGDTENPIEYWRERNVDLSKLARQVSGSGCRSIYGGFVEWFPGDDEESTSHQAFTRDHWGDLVAIAVPLHTKPKKVPSTLGMQTTTQTCPWITWRASNVVPKRIEDAKECVAKKDFSKLAEIIIRESNELHANCMATYPSIRYLNDSSYQVIDAITQLNNSKERNIAAYSFDAGPNPFVFTEEANLHEVEQTLKNIEGIKYESDYIKAHPASGIVNKLIS